MTPSRQDEDETKDQLINELVVLRQRIAELEALEIKHKQVEEALRESEETYRALVDHMTEGYMIVRGNRIKFANIRWAEILGIPPEKLIGENYWKFVPPENQEQTRQIFAKVTGGGEIPRLWEFVHPGADGRGIPIEVSIREVIYEGKPSYAVVLRDITERKQADEALKQSESRYRDLFNSASDAILIRDLEGNIFEVNQAASELTGYTADELVKMNISEFLTPESFDIAMEMQQKWLEGKTTSQRYELEIIRMDGTRAIIDVAIRLITENAQPVAVQATVRDITEYKRFKENMQFYIAQITKAQEEERKRIARELHDDTAQVLGSLSREVDNFIRKKTSLLPDEVAFLRYLREQLNRGLQGVHRFSQDLRSPILDDLGLLPALRSLANEMKEYNRIDVELRVLGSEKRFTPEVELLIFRIVQEALSNIRRHAEASRAWVVMEFAEGKTRLTISDNGQGFELPGRLDDLPRSGKLGLAGIQERVRLIGGTLELQSTPGKGTTLMVEIPN